MSSCRPRNCRHPRAPVVALIMRTRRVRWKQEREEKKKKKKKRNSRAEERVEERRVKDCPTKRGTRDAQFPQTRIAISRVHSHRPCGVRSLRARRSRRPFTLDTWNTRWSRIVDRAPPILFCQNDRAIVHSVAVAVIVIRASFRFVSSYRG